MSIEKTTPIVTPNQLKELQSLYVILWNLHLPSLAPIIWVDFIRDGVRTNGHMQISSVGGIVENSKETVQLIKILEKSLTALKDVDVRLKIILEQFKICPKCKGKQSPNPKNYGGGYWDCETCLGHGYLCK